MPGMSRVMRPDRERDVVSSIGNAAAFFAIRTIKKSAENPENRAFFRVFDECLALEASSKTPEAAVYFLGKLLTLDV
ncbi:hypothetical protein [Burkholderia multivorans]|nr:hypothetical protein [Burkholderia multivorans]